MVVRLKFLMQTFVKIERCYPLSIFSGLQINLRKNLRNQIVTHIFVAE